MKTALATGATFWNGGELYGSPERNSLHLLNEYFTKYPEDADKVVLSIKGGLVPGQMAPDGSEKNVKRSIDECLRVLDGKKKLDLFECARVDPKTPIEITVQAMVPYIKEGKLGGISLSECSADSIRRAAKVHKISAVEVGYNMTEGTGLMANGFQGGSVTVEYGYLRQWRCSGLRRARHSDCCVLASRKRVLGKSHDLIDDKAASANTHTDWPDQVV